MACQAPLPMGFPRQQYWSGLPFPSSGNLSNPGIEPTSPVALANWQVDSLTTEPPEKPKQPQFATTGTLYFIDIYTCPTNTEAA